MANSQSLAVGLAVGIPSFVIILVVALFWYRNQHKQMKEDLRDNEFDIGLQDDHSFNQFHEELHKRKEKNEFLNTREEERFVGDSSETTNSNDGQQHSTSTINKNLQNSYHRPIITKPQSSYDFYETFIPVLPSSNQQQSQQQSVENHHHHHHHHIPGTSSVPGSTSDINDSNDQTAADSTTSLVNFHKQSSLNDLDTLAKQLNNPAFFEKLPSRAATAKYQVKPRFPTNGPVGSNSYSYNNSSSDLINNYLIGETHAINDHFVYEAPRVEVTEKESKEIPVNQHGEDSSEADATESSTSTTPFNDKHKLVN